MGRKLVFQMEREIVFCGVRLILRMRIISILEECMGPQASVHSGLCPSLPSEWASTLSGTNAKDQFMKL